MGLMRGWEWLNWHNTIVHERLNERKITRIIHDKWAECALH